MATTAATLPPDIARQVIAPESYAEWNDVLDTFDRLREEAPVARVVAEDDSFEPFWLIIVAYL